MPTHLHHSTYPLSSPTPRRLSLLLALAATRRSKMLTTIVTAFNIGTFSTCRLCLLNTRRDFGVSEVTRSSDREPMLSGDSRIASLLGGGVSKCNAVRRVDEELAKGNERTALAIVSALQGVPGGFSGFGAAQQVPQQLYSLEDLRLNKIETSCFLSPVDTTLSGVRRNLQLTAVFGGILLWKTMNLNQLQLLSIFLMLTVFSAIDLLVNGGGMEALIIDTIGRVFSQVYRDRVCKHEAGHFLIGYLLGVLAKSYTLSSLDACQKSGFQNVQAGTTFVDFQFQEEVKDGKISSESLNRYSCIALAGVATEYLLFGLAEGGLADIQQLDSLFKSLGFTQKKADSQVRWAVLNTITLLRRHNIVHENLATAMNSGKSVGECIAVIERALEDVPYI